MSGTLTVTKRDGSIQPLEIDKIHKVLEWACYGANDDALKPIKGVAPSAIEIQARLNFHEKISTKKIHTILIDAAASLISEDTPNYDKVAARLVWFAVRKEAYKNNIPPHLYTIITKNVKEGFYSKELLSLYTPEEYDEINGYIRHERDDLFHYAGAMQMRKKYLAQHRKTKKVYESFQIPFIMVAALKFSGYPKEERLAYIKRYYDIHSQNFISNPTPIMADLRTVGKQFSSCTKIEVGDTLDSIGQANLAILGYASRKAGIGLHVGNLRAKDQPVRKGHSVTEGVFKFSVAFNAVLKSCAQGGVRGASATFNWPWWHLDHDHLIECKNEKGTPETRIPTVDWCIHLNGYLFKRAMMAQDDPETFGKVTFFSPEEVPDLTTAFYSADQDKFAELYEKYEKQPGLTKKQYNVMDILAKIVEERYETGRYYIMFVDNVNQQTPFYDPIRMTNLCCEILLPTQPLKSLAEAKGIEGDTGRIALCTLSAINWGKFGLLDTPEEEKLFAEVCEMDVRGLDALLDYQEYPFIQAELATKEYRPLGIGVIGFAHWLAKNNLRWGEENTLRAVERMMEKMSYYLIKASVQLAKEKGACKRTKYHDGIFQFELSKLRVETTMPWEELRAEMMQYGIRNATLMAFMPSETSSQISNETNGIEPPMALVTLKGSKDGTMPQVVPGYAALNHRYQLRTEVSNKAYFDTISRIQIFADQGISANTVYRPTEETITTARLIGDIIYAWQQGVKTLYYDLKFDGSGEEPIGGMDSGCGDACKI